MEIYASHTVTKKNHLFPGFHNVQSLPLFSYLLSIFLALKDPVRRMNSRNTGDMQYSTSAKS